MEKICFCLAWCWIGLISAFDASMLVYFQNVIEEINPLTLGLLRAFGVAGLVGIKMFGTILALGILAFLCRYWPEAGFTAAVIVAGFQTGLLIFLLS